MEKVIMVTSDPIVNIYFLETRRPLFTGADKQDKYISCEGFDWHVHDHLTLD